MGGESSVHFPFAVRNVEFEIRCPPFRTSSTGPISIVAPPSAKNSPPRCSHKTTSRTKTTEHCYPQLLAIPYTVLINNVLHSTQNTKTVCGYPRLHPFSQRCHTSVSRIGRFFSSLFGRGGRLLRFLQNKSTNQSWPCHRRCWSICIITAPKGAIRSFAARLLRLSVSGLFQKGMKNVQKLQSFVASLQCTKGKTFRDASYPLDVSSKSRDLVPCALYRQPL